MGSTPRPVFAATSATSADARADFAKSFSGLTTPIHWCRLPDPHLIATVEIHDAAMFVVQATNDACRALRTVVQDVRGRFPALPIIAAYREPLGERMRLALADAGVDRFIGLNAPNADAVLRNILTAHLDHSLHPIHDLLTPVPDGGRGRAIEAWCLRTALTPTSVSAIAFHFGVDRKTVYRSARGRGWACAEALTHAARLVHIAIALEETNLTSTLVARRLHFASATALHKYLRRTIAMTPAMLRREGALAIAFRNWNRRGCRAS
jgi:AraC-like DNA-binding protein